MLFDLFKNIDMPTVEVLAEMQWNGMYLSVKELDQYGDEIKENGINNEVALCRIS